MALSRHHASFTRPQSIQEIVSEAETFEFSTLRSLQAWLRSAQMLNTEAAMCENDGNLQLAYLYLYRHAILIFERLPTHPDFRNPAYRKDVNAAQRSVKTNLAKLEKWKPSLNRKYQLYTEAVKQRNAKSEIVQAESRMDSARKSVSSIDTLPLDGSERRTINANEHKDLAIDLAQREIRRRNATKSIRRPEYISSTGHGESAQIRHILQDDVNNISNSIQRTGRVLEENRIGRDSNKIGTLPNTRIQSYQYPVVPAKKSETHWEALMAQPESSNQAPRIPSKHHQPLPNPTQSTPIPPPKQKHDLPASPSATAQYTFQPISATESGSPLRTLLLPPSLRTDFLNLAHANTARNLETCGILCGTAIHGALFITHLILPDQTATSDTCDTTDEGDTVLFDYCDAHSLLVCGWIHTHPSQSCFLSSRDLHTSAGYQVMLPEAIAIVCAPRQNPDWGIFRLTDPPGLGAVLDCTAPGLFHPHAETNLYTDALRPGHVVEAAGLEFEVVDLRKKR